MYLIATDEAGYGPKLGPLVIAATAWSVPDLATVEMSGDASCFALLRRPVQCGPLRVAVDDSKSVFQRAASDSRLRLQLAVSAGCRWFGFQSDSFNDLLTSIAAEDLADIAATAWLNHVGQPLMPVHQTAPIVAQWSQSEAKLLGVIARTVPARRFNLRCDAAGNKASVLSELTLGLVRSWIERLEAGQATFEVYCDRHGGRKFYAGVLQHTFPDWHVTIRTESSAQSVYQLVRNERRITIRFTVKGDSFTPVAFSSLFAKYLREQFMASMNHYFARRFVGAPPLRPTAGYPADADRFLRDVSAIIADEQINLVDLVRSR